MREGSITGSSGKHPSGKAPLKKRCIVFAVGIALAVGAAKANVWNLDIDGAAFSDTTKWNESAYPNAQDAVADMSQVAWTIGSNLRTITNDVSVTLGSIVFGRTGGAWAGVQFTNASTETITLDSSTGTCTISVANLNYGATLDIILTGNDDLLITSTSGKGFTGLRMHKQNTYTGDTYINCGVNGEVTLGISSTGPAGSPTAGPLGTGTIYLEDGARLGSAYTDITLANPIVIRGSVDIGTGQNLNIIMTGPVTLTTNAAVSQNGTYVYEQTRFQGNIGQDSPGRSLTLSSFGTTEAFGGDMNIWLEGDNTYTGGTIVEQGRVIFSGNNSAATGPFTVKPGAFAEIRSTNAISDRSAVYLQFDGGTSYGKLDMEANVTVRNLYLNGVKQEAGDYDKNSHPDYFDSTSTSILTVAPPYGTVVRIR